jgi:hypothetical protein
MVELAEYHVPDCIRRRFAALTGEKELLTRSHEIAAQMLFPLQVPGLSYPAQFNFHEPFVCLALLNEEVASDRRYTLRSDRFHRRSRPLSNKVLVFKLHRECKLGCAAAGCLEPSGLNTCAKQADCDRMCFDLVLVHMSSDCASNPHEAIRFRVLCYCGRRLAPEV